MKQKIVKDIVKLSKPCVPVKNTKKGIKIGEELLELLRQTENGVGLAANQVGITHKVCVVNVGKPIILVNPEITGKFDKIYFQEACLSFPGDYVITKRYANIAVKADNYPEILLFSKEKNLLECVCVQHEIDHLNGKTMYDREVQKGV